MHVSEIDLIDNVYDVMKMNVNVLSVNVIPIYDVLSYTRLSPWKRSERKDILKIDK